MSYFSKFVWHPLLAAIARASGSSHAGTAAAGQAASDALARLGQDVHDQLAGGLTANSAMAVANSAIKDLEDGLKAAADAYLMGALPVGLGGLAAGGVNLGLDFVESHAHDYLSALFHHAKTNQPPVPT